MTISSAETDKDSLTKPPENLELTFVQGSFALDPVFRKLRKKHFDPKGTWREFRLPGGANLMLAPSSVKMGPIPARAFLPAFGWETRPLDRFEILGKPEWEALLGQLKGTRGWDTLQLTCLLPAELDALRPVAKELGFHLLESTFPVRVIPGYGSYARYMETRGSSTRRNLKQAFSRAKKNELEMRTDLRWEDLREVFGAKVVASGAGPDYTKSPEFLAFFKEFRDEMKAVGRFLEVGVFLRGKLIGFDLGVWTGRLVHAYQTGYDAKYSEHRPGAIAFEKLIETALDAEAAQIDFMGDYPYMKSYSKTVLDLRRVTLIAPNITGFAISALLKAKSLFGRGSTPKSAAGEAKSEEGPEEEEKPA